MRRAKARVEIGTSASLSGAEKDLTNLSASSYLSPLDRNTVHKSLVELKPKLKAATDRDLKEAMDKFKDLGNMFLKPFGMSTDNFKFEKDEKSGGYSMNFNQGGK